MNKEIKIEDILDYQKKYKSDVNNLELEKNINVYGIKKACLNNDLANAYSYQFNIEIPEVKMYDQKRSSQCNIYAFLRVLKSIMQKENPSLNINALDLSANYLDFYDKLEKINTLYNELLTEKNITLEIINNKVNRYVGIYGTFHFCRELVKKYGLVPISTMKEASSHYDAFETLELLKIKIKTDATCLLNCQETDKSELKEELMKEAYQFLSKTMGNPPTSFKYEGEIFTPQLFRDKFLSSNLDDFITITSFPKEIYFESYAYIPNVYLGDTEKIKTLSVDKMKEVVLNQLEDGIAVWFSSEESTALDYNVNILDNHIYKFNDFLNIKSIFKEEQLLLDIINYDHAMCITGALVENNQVKQFKVENSFGKHGQYKGHLIMTNSFFENDIISIIIHKKYLE